MCTTLAGIKGSGSFDVWGFIAEQCQRDGGTITLGNCDFWLDGDDVIQSIPMAQIDRPAMTRDILARLEGR